MPICKINNQIIFRDYGDILLFHDKQRYLFFICEGVAADIVRAAIVVDTISDIEDDLLSKYEIADNVAVIDDINEVLSNLHSSLVLDYENHPNKQANDYNLLKDNLFEDFSEDDALDFCAQNLIPYSVTWELTFNCNLKCIHCYCPEHQATFWSMARVKNILAQLKQLGVVDIEFTGGECFAHPQIDEILKLAHSEGFLFSILTNGLLLNEERVQLIASLHPRCVQLSVYSMVPEIHESITGIPGSLERTLDALLALKENGVRVQIACTILKLNASCVEYVASWAKMHDIPALFGFKLTNSENPSRSPENYQVDSDILAKLLQNADINPVARAKKTKKRLKQELDGPICQAGFRNLCLSGIGEVFPCNSLRMPLGNILESSIKEIWLNSKQLQDWRRLTVSSFEDCKHCSAREVCEPCPASYYAETKEITRIQKNDCRIGKLYFDNYSKIYE